MCHDPVRLALIASHLKAAIRIAQQCQHIYPHEDVEVAAMQALYLAAFTWRPGKRCFYAWFRVKFRAQLTWFRRRKAERPFSDEDATEAAAGVCYHDKEWYSDG